MVSLCIAGECKSLKAVRKSDYPQKTAYDELQRIQHIVIKSAYIQSNGGKTIHLRNTMYSTIAVYHDRHVKQTTQH